MNRVMGLLIALLSNPLFAIDEVRVAVDSKPPYMMTQKEGADWTGWTVDVVSETLATERMTAKFVSVPLQRALKAFNAKEVDIATFAKADGEWTNISSWPIMRFHNIAVTLKSRKISLHAISDLAQYRVASFQGASKYMGPEFAAQAAKNPDYKEFTGYMPSRMLLTNRIDVIVVEPNIFRYWLAKQSKDYEREEREVEYHDLFGPGNNYWFAFKDDELKKKFEHGLIELFRSGKFDEIGDKYHRLYGLDSSMFQPIYCRFAKKNC